VMHGMDGEVDMRKYGALRKAMPLTFISFLAGYLAIIGVPPFAGFFTKDKIIEAAFDTGGTQGWVFGVAALLGAGITAFYMTRMVIMTFFGDARWKDDTHPHESPTVMTAPVAVLAVLSLVSGAFLILGSRLVNWLTPVFGPVPEATHTIAPAALTAVILGVVAVGVAWAYWQYGTRPVAALAPTRVTPLTVAARRDLYGDDLNEAVFMRPGQYLTRFLVFFDNRVVDGAVNAFAALVGGVSSRSRRLQTGFARSYALSMFAGAAIVVVAIVLVRI